MRFWNQLAISVVVLAVGGAAWVRFAPGAGETLAAIGVSQPLIDALSGPQDGQAGSGGSGNAGRGQGGRGQGGGLAALRTFRWSSSGRPRAHSSTTD